MKTYNDREDFIDEQYGLSHNALDRLLRLTCKPSSNVLIAMYDNARYEQIKPFVHKRKRKLANKEKNEVTLTIRPIPKITRVNKNVKSKGFEKDKIYIGDTLELLYSWSCNNSARFDLIFADPPYNLEKNYGELDDNLKDLKYIEWCDKWLSLCANLLKPFGSFYILNLPKWSIFHATLLNKLLWFQRWIVWDALSDPRGKIMPAHYGLLLYTKHPTRFTYNKIPPIPKMDQCFRQKCIKNRLHPPKEELSDIWYDVHRIKHKRDRDAHPCQLPLKLLERIIQVSTNPADIVLDPFLGTGTTAVAAKKLKRSFVGIDIDLNYKEIALNNLSELENSQNNSSMIQKRDKNQLTLFEY